jgi:hypothetical protein
MLEYFEHEAQPWGSADLDGRYIDGPDEDEPKPEGSAREAVPAGPRPPSIRHISV